MQDKLTALLNEKIARYRFLMDKKCTIFLCLLKESNKLNAARHLGVEMPHEKLSEAVEKLQASNYECDAELDGLIDEINDAYKAKALRDFVDMWVTQKLVSQPPISPPQSQALDSDGHPPGEWNPAG